MPDLTAAYDRLVQVAQAAHDETRNREMERVFAAGKLHSITPGRLAIRAAVAAVVTELVSLGEQHEFNLVDLVAESLRDPRPARPSLAETRTGTDWCRRCNEEAGTDRYTQESSTLERCGVCSAVLVPIPADPQPAYEPTTGDRVTLKTTDLTGTVFGQLFRDDRWGVVWDDGRSSFEPAGELIPAAPSPGDQTGTDHA